MIPKFRAWYKKGTLPMLKVNLISFDQQLTDVYIDDEVFAETEMSFDFDDVILMQSTGLKDRNGIEVFEGDIVHAYSEVARLIGVIEYFDNAYCIKTKNAIYNSLWLNAEHYEVIGNIHEKPDLMEGLNGE